MSGSRIAVLFSPGRAASPATQAVTRALAAQGHAPVPIAVDDVAVALAAQAIERGFLADLGERDRDGWIQDLLEQVSVPYTGSGPLAAALAGRLGPSRARLRFANLPTPSHHVVPAGLGSEAIRVHHGDVGFPAVVRSQRIGGDGVIVRDADELCAACLAAEGSELVVERQVTGLALAVVVLHGRALGTIDRATGGPPRLGAGRLAGIHRLAERAHLALGCAGLSEVDLVVTRHGNEQLLAVDAQPSLAPDGPAARLAEQDGLGLEGLVATLVAGARLHRDDRAAPATIALPRSAEAA